MAWLTISLTEKYTFRELNHPNLDIQILKSQIKMWKINTSHEIA